eukprot:Skav224075  [mRNA]  locus=scaffold942:62012:63389:- [translate_table: standard]
MWPVPRGSVPLSPGRRGVSDMALATARPGRRCGARERRNVVLLASRLLIFTGVVGVFFSGVPGAVAGARGTGATGVTGGEGTSQLKAVQMSRNKASRLRMMGA